jgi:serine/threonine protein kinase
MPAKASVQRSEPAPVRGGLAERYVIVERLGRGGMGVVYRAYDSELDRHVAVKLVRADLAGGERLKQRLIREAQAMARLSHPNVVTVFDVGEANGQVFVAMELLEGGTLATWLRAERRSGAEILRRFLAAGRGLEAAHAAGFVHRDFKPDNVLLGPGGRVCVTDFGLARLVGEAAGPPTPSPSSPLPAFGDALT